MPTKKLTQSLVNSLTVTDKPQELFWDTELPGFGVLVNRAGTKSYVIQRDNKRRKLERTDALPLAKARELARQTMVDLRRGVDPKVVRRQEAEAERRAKVEATTLRQALESYLRTRKNLRPATRRDYEKTLERYCSDWMNAPLGNLLPEDVARRHERICQDVAKGRKNGGRKRNRMATGHSAANGTMRVVRAVWNHARVARLVEGDNPVSVISHARGWYPERRRDTVIAADQLPAFVKAVKALRSENSRDLILLMLYTGLRVREACTLEWRDVDLKNQLLHLPAERTKAGRALDLPLSDTVTKLLSARPVVGKWVFPGVRGHAKEPKAALAVVEKATGHHITSHDLRRTFTTVAYAARVPEVEIKAMVNHALGTDVTAGYHVPGPEWLREPVRMAEAKYKELLKPRRKAAIG